MVKPYSYSFLIDNKNQLQTIICSFFKLEEERQIVLLEEYLLSS